MFYKKDLAYNVTEIVRLYSDFKAGVIGKEDFEKSFKFTADWIIPQAQAVIVGSGFNDTDGLRFIQHLKNTKNNLYFVALIVLNNINPGKMINGSASNAKNIHYSAGVPKILQAFKIHKKIPYSAWTNVDALLSEQLVYIYRVWPKVMSVLREHFPDPSLLNEAILEYRDACLTTLGGTKYLPTSHHFYSGDSKFSDLPNAGKVYNAIKDNVPFSDSWYFVRAFAQTWIWHPSIRHPDMITDFENLDAQRPPLVVSAIEPAKPEPARDDWLLEAMDLSVLKPKAEKFEVKPEGNPWD